MKKLIVATTVASALATALYAGGPVVVEDEAVVAEAAPTSKGWVVPALLLAVIGLAIVTSDDSDTTRW